MNFLSLLFYVKQIKIIKILWKNLPNVYIANEMNPQKTYLTEAEYAEIIQEIVDNF